MLGLNTLRMIGELNTLRMIGECPGRVAGRVWDNVPSYPPMDFVWGNSPTPNELHVGLSQISLGKAAGEDEVTAELLKFGGDNLWEVVARVCREQWLLLTEAAPGAEVVWLDEWCVGLVIPSWKRKGTRRTRIPGEVLLFCPSALSCKHRLWQLG